MSRERNGKSPSKDQASGPAKSVWCFPTQDTNSTILSEEDTSRVSSETCGATWETFSKTLTGGSKYNDGAQNKEFVIKKRDFPELSQNSKTSKTKYDNGNSSHDAQNQKFVIKKCDFPELSQDSKVSKTKAKKVNTNAYPPDGSELATELDLDFGALAIKDNTTTTEQQFSQAGGSRGSRGYRKPAFSSIESFKWPVPMRNTKQKSRIFTGNRNFAKTGDSKSSAAPCSLEARNASTNAVATDNESSRPNSLHNYSLDFAKTGDSKSSAAPCSLEARNASTNAEATDNEPSRPDSLHNYSLEETESPEAVKVDETAEADKKLTEDRSLADGGDGNETASSILQDAYGLRALCSAIRGSRDDPVLHELVFGVDAVKLMQDSKREIHSNCYVEFEDIGGPKSGDSKRKEDFEDPGVYAFSSQVRSNLPALDFSKMGLEALFYCFYTNPQRILQLQVSKQLYERGWFYYKPHQIWVQKQENEIPYVETDSYETGLYKSFDPLLWRIVQIPLKVNKSLIDGPPVFYW